MDMSQLKAANAFAILCRKAFGEPVPLSTFDDRRKALALLERAASHGDPKLSQAALDLSKAMRLPASIRPVAPNPLASKPAPRPAAIPPAARAVPDAPAGITELEWEIISQCAFEAAGPASSSCLQAARAAKPASFRAAALLAQELLGAVGPDFAAAMRRHF